MSKKARKGRPSPKRHLEESGRPRSEPGSVSRAPARLSAVLVLGTVVIAGMVFALWYLLGKTGQPSSLSLENRNPPNVLFISVDTLRADYIGVYGARLATPNVDALARGGILFENAVSHVPITLPSHASMLTGMYPIAHGIRDNGSFRLADDKETLAESLRAAGYRTAAFVGSFALDSRFGLNQGFEVYDDYYGDTGAWGDFAISERPADAVLEPAQAWLDRQGAERWFLFLHIYDPHAPYEPPSRFAESHPDDLYAGEVAYVDDALGRFLSHLGAAGLLENTLIVFTADHGEGLGEHGEKTHGMFAYESTMRVPLVFRWPGVLPEGRRVSSRVRLIDLAPTLFELTSRPPAASHQGESLVGLMVDPQSGPDRESYFEALAFNLNRNWAPLTGLYRDHFKYIDLPIAELYDLAVDPKEARNLFEDNPGRSRQMAGALSLLVDTYSTAESRAIRTAEVDAETVERLKTLGYTVAPQKPKATSEYTPDDDPKRLVHLSDRLDAGVAAFMAGKPEQAVRLFQSIIDERPSFANAYANWAHVLYQTGDLHGAIAVLEQAMERGAPTRTTLARLGMYLQEAGRLSESATILESVIEEDPTYAEAYNYLGVSYSRLGRIPEAIRCLEKVIELDPSYASAFSNLGSIYLGTNRPQEAEAAFRRALELDPRLAAAWNGIGVVHAQNGRQEEAISAWKRTVELDPREYDTLFNLGTLLTKLNRFDEAIPHLEQFVRIAPRERYADDIPKVQRLVSELKRQAERRP